jgi:hypothetical protein
VNNNRAVVKQIAIPDGVAYADVDGQPEEARKLVRAVAGGADIVLLPSGTELRIGLTQPQQARQVQVTPSRDRLHGVCPADQHLGADAPADPDGQQLAPHVQGAAETWRVIGRIGWPVEPANPPRALEMHGVDTLVVHATYVASVPYK